MIWWFPATQNTAGLEWGAHWMDDGHLPPQLDFDFGNGIYYCHRVTAPGLAQSQPQGFRHALGCSDGAQCYRCREAGIKPSTLRSYDFNGSQVALVPLNIAAGEDVNMGR